MSETDYKSLYEQTERSYRTLAEQSLDRDKAELQAKEEAERAKKPPPPDRLGPAKALYESMVQDAEWVEACRTVAWLATSIHRTKPNREGWPPGVTMESYCRKELGINEDGTAMLDAPTEEPEPELRTDTSLHKLLRERHRM